MGMEVVLPKGLIQKAADVWKKDVWDFQSFSQTSLELRFSLGNEGKDGKNLNSQTWPGTPRRPSSRHPRPRKTKESQAPVKLAHRFPALELQAEQFRTVGSF